MAGQRLVGVLVAGHGAGRQVVQLDPAGPAAEQPLGRVRVQGQGPGTPGVVRAKAGPAGLVVDDDQLGAEVVDPVDPAVLAAIRAAASPGS